MKKSFFLMIVALFTCALSANAQFTTYQPSYSRSQSTPSYSQGGSYGGVPFTVYEPIVVDPRTGVNRRPSTQNRTSQSTYPYTTYKPVTTLPKVDKYYATSVLYESSTGQESTYKLKVGVTNGRVVKIVLNDQGGCVHSGTNNSGYTFSGGKITKAVVDGEEYIYTEVLAEYETGFWQKFLILF